MKALSLWHGVMLVTNHSETMRAVADDVCERWRISLAELKGPGRTMRLIVPRHEFCYEARRLGKSLTQIGRFLNRDHTTVLHGDRAHARRMRGAESLQGKHVRRAA